MPRGSSLATQGKRRRQPEPSAVGTRLWDQPRTTGPRAYYSSETKWRLTRPRRSDPPNGGSAYKHRAITGTRIEYPYRQRNVETIAQRDLWAFEEGGGATSGCISAKHHRRLGDHVKYGTVWTKSCLERRIMKLVRETQPAGKPRSDGS